ncbi:MAG TPA: hypothetical protein VNL77_18945 [Roseiflexaceae bacterium]|nr:hypothetical protein [Roseiflexaceae bacterium]
MPHLTQLMVRTALLWLGLGYTAGGLALLAKGVSALAWLWPLRGSHVHMLLVGWTVQLAFGVAFWMLPRLDAAGSRGDTRPAWLSYLALNAGVLLAALHAPLGTSAPGWIPVAAGLLYLAAIAAFAAHAWRRVLPFRTLPRPRA